MDFQGILDKISEEVQPVIPQGRVADYIPKLAAVPKEKFGMAVQTLKGDLYTTGDANENFSIQSISKAYTLTLHLNCSQLKLDVYLLAHPFFSTDRLKNDK